MLPAAASQPVSPPLPNGCTALACANTQVLPLMHRKQELTAEKLQLHRYSPESAAVLPSSSCSTASRSTTSTKFIAVAVPPPNSPCLQSHLLPAHSPEPLALPLSTKIARTCCRLHGHVAMATKTVLVVARAPHCRSLFPNPSSEFHVLPRCSSVLPFYLYRAGRNGTWSSFLV